MLLVFAKSSGLQCPRPQPVAALPPVASPILLPPITVLPAPPILIPLAPSPPETATVLTPPELGLLLLTPRVLRPVTLPVTAAASLPAQTPLPLRIAA